MRKKYASQLTPLGEVDENILKVEASTPQTHLGAYPHFTLSDKWVVDMRMSFLTSVNRELVALHLCKA